jgi:hypothetical protein
MTESTTVSLADRVLAAIEETERIARAANVVQDDPEWFASPVVDSRPRTFRIRSAQDYRPIATVQDLAGDSDVVGILDGEAASRHIAHNDPVIVLRRCAADRAILALHQVAGRACTGDPDLPTAWRDYCGTCGSGEPNEYPTWWPCDTLRALAEGYGIE